jgi:hypothetical protein
MTGCSEKLVGLSGAGYGNGRRSPHRRAWGHRGRRTPQPPAFLPFLPPGSPIIINVPIVSVYRSREAFVLCRWLPSYCWEDRDIGGSAGEPTSQFLRGCGSFGFTLMTSYRESYFYYFYFVFFQGSSELVRINNLERCRILARSRSFRKISAFYERSVVYKKVGLS